MHIPSDPLPFAVSGFSIANDDERDPPESTPELLADVGLPCQAVREVPAGDAGAGPGPFVPSERGAWEGVSGDRSGAGLPPARNEPTSATRRTTMAFGKNYVELIGRLGRDAEIHELRSGGKVANLSVATDEGYFSKSRVS